MWPNNSSLCHLVTSTNVIWRLSVFSWLTLSFVHTFRSLQYNLSLNASILIYSAFRVHISAAYNKWENTWNQQSTYASSNTGTWCVLVCKLLLSGRITRFALWGYENVVFVDLQLSIVITVGIHENAGNDLSTARTSILSAPKPSTSSINSYDTTTKSASPRERQWNTRISVSFCLGGYCEQFVTVVKLSPLWQLIWLLIQIDGKLFQWPLFTFTAVSQCSSEVLKERFGFAGVIFQRSDHPDVFFDAQSTVPSHWKRQCISVVDQM